MNTLTTRLIFVGAAVGRRVRRGLLRKVVGRHTLDETLSRADRLRDLQSPVEIAVDKNSTVVSEGESLSHSTKPKAGGDPRRRRAPVTARGCRRGISVLPFSLRMSGTSPT